MNFVIDTTTLNVLMALGILGTAMGVIGCFGVLRGQGLVGDALAHCTLPGLCLGFVLNAVTQSNLRTFWLTLGALITGLWAVYTIHWLTTRTRLPADLAISGVLGGGFAFGTLLLSVIQLWPTAGQAGLQNFLFGQAAGLTRDEFRLIVVTSTLALIVATLGGRGFSLILFDETLGRLQGWPTTRLQGVMVGLAALLTVVALPAVGLVLAVALLITPALTARLWVTRWRSLGPLAGVLGGVAAILGVLWSRYGGVPTGAAVVLVATGLFFLSLFFAPRRGVLATSWRRYRQQQRWRRQLQHATAPTP